MTLDRLTEKAKELVLEASKEKKLTSKVVLKHLTTLEGMGKFLIDTIPPTSVKKTLPVDLNKLIKEAYYQAVKLQHKYVGTEHIYLALLRLSDSKHLERARVTLYNLGAFPNTDDGIDLSIKNHILNSFGEDLNKKLLIEIDDPIIYREPYKKLTSALLLKEKSNVLLVGDEGVGRHTIVELLVRNINSLDVPPSLVGYNLVTLDVLAFMTNLANKGGLEFGISALIEELKSNKRIILVLENFQDMFMSTPAGLTIPIFYSILKASLERAGIKFITFINTSMYERIVMENEHVLNNLTIVEVEEPSRDETIEILKTAAIKLMSYHNVNISDEIIEYIYKKAESLNKNVKMPQRAIDLLDNTCAYLIFRKSSIPGSYKDMVDASFNLASELDNQLSAGEYEKALKTKEKISTLEKSLSTKEKRIFSFDKTLKVTVKDVDEMLFNLDIEENEVSNKTILSKLSRLPDRIKKQVIGQDDAVDVITKALIRAQLGLRAKKRPLGNFLFLGPTGVGKTELAKVLAKTVFKKDNHSGLIRLDMSDFAEKHNVARLVGAPPGYVGYGEGGELTSKIEANPNSVVLFDEIEKAHPDVLNILLQIMEEGELSDARGNTFDFSKSVVILTSNLGTQFVHSIGMGFEEKELNDNNLENRLKNNLKKILKPELLNRFDEIVVFKRLTKVDQSKILNVLIKEVTETLTSQNVDLKVNTNAKKYLLEKGFSKEYGAREMRRIVEKELLDKVAKVLISKEKRPLKLEADAVGDGLKPSRLGIKVL